MLKIGYLWIVVQEVLVKQDGFWFNHVLFFINCNIHTGIYIVYNESWD